LKRELVAISVAAVIGGSFAPQGYQLCLSVSQYIAEAKSTQHQPNVEARCAPKSDFFIATDGDLWVVTESSIRSTFLVYILPRVADDLSVARYLLRLAILAIVHLDIQRIVGHGTCSAELVDENLTGKEI